MSTTKRKRTTRDLSGPRRATWVTRTPSGGLVISSTSDSAHLEVAYHAHLLRPEHLAVVRSETCLACDGSGEIDAGDRRRPRWAALRKPCPAHTDAIHTEEPFDRAAALRALGRYGDGRVQWIASELPLATLWPDRPLATSAEVADALAYVGRAPLWPGTDDVHRAALDATIARLRALPVAA